MNGQERSTCHYHKYGYCREKNGCERFHSSVICSKTNCDVKNCRDRHPQQCKFFASQDFCKFGDSCMYDHKPDQKKSLKAEFEDLKKRFDEVMKVTSKQDETIKFLQYKVDMMGKQMIGAVREMSEHIEYIEDVTGDDGKIEKMDIEHPKTERKENLDDSYDIYSDAQFKEIIEKQRGIAASLENNLGVIQSSVKKKKVEETLSSLTELQSIVQNDEKELKQLLGKDIRYMEHYKNEQEYVPNESVATGYESDDDSEDEDYWEPKMDEMFNYFYEMVKNIEKLPGNNFKKGADLEMKKVIEMADKMKRDRNELVENEFNV